MTKRATQTTRSCRSKHRVPKVRGSFTSIPRAAASPPSIESRAYNPGHSLSDASCLTKWRQNERHPCGISFHRVLCSLERARSTQRQFRPMWRRVGLPAANAKGTTCCIYGPPHSRAFPRGLHAGVLWQTCWGGCFLGRAFPLPLPSPTKLHTTSYVVICFIHNCLTRARPPLRPRERGLGGTLQIEAKGEILSISPVLTNSASLSIACSLPCLTRRGTSRDTGGCASSACKKNSV